MGATAPEDLEEPEAEGEEEDVELEVLVELVEAEVPHSCF